MSALRPARLAFFSVFSLVALLALAPTAVAAGTTDPAAPSTQPATAAPPATTPPPATGATTPATPAVDGSTPAATPAGPETPAATAPEGTPADGTVASTEPPPGIRLRKLEQKVQELKEQAWRIKARVGMLKEAVLGGGIGARASITHENKMGGSFRMIKILYALDGQQIYSRADESGKLDENRNIEILAGPISPGNHTLSVLVVYRGHGFGVFEYLKKYKFTVRTSHTFAVPEGKAINITVVGYEKGGATTPMDKRPAVDFKVNIVSEVETTAPKAQ
jgi:hypothetical protein